MEIQLPFDEDLFNTTAKEKKKEKRNIKRKYNKEMQSKMVDSGFQFRFNDHLFCRINRAEKSEKEKKEYKKKSIYRLSLQC